MGEGQRIVNMNFPPVSPRRELGSSDLATSGFSSWVISLAVGFFQGPVLASLRSTWYKLELPHKKET